MWSQNEWRWIWVDRRDVLEIFKKAEKDKQMTEDDRKYAETEVQKLTDKYIANIDKAVDVTKLEKPTIPYGQVGKITNKGKDSYRELARCELFGAGVISLKEKFSIKSNDSFTSLVVLEGNAKIKWKKDEMDVEKLNEENLRLLKKDLVTYYKRIELLKSLGIESSSVKKCLYVSQSSNSVKE